MNGNIRAKKQTERIVQKYSLRRTDRQMPDDESYALLNAGPYGGNLRKPRNQGLRPRQKRSLHKGK